VIAVGTDRTGRLWKRLGPRQFRDLEPAHNSSKDARL
jgi:hypothetical protein